jgi:hypothetical protein
MSKFSNAPDKSIFPERYPFEEIALKYPIVVLGDSEACKNLSDDQFDYCIREIPAYALIHSHSCNRLDEQFSYCIKMAPCDALTYFPPYSRLSDIQFEDLLKKTRIRGSFSLITERMTAYQKSWMKTCHI